MALQERHLVGWSQSRASGPSDETFLRLVIEQRAHGRPNDEIFAGGIRT